MMPLDTPRQDAPTDPAKGAFTAPSQTVLIVDDERSILESLGKIFEREGVHVLQASDGAAGLDLLRKHRVGVLLTDLMMPRTTGMDLLKAAKTVAPETEVVLMTAYGTVETAVDAMKEGAYDFVTKPLKRAHVVRIVRNALDKQSLVVENRALRAQLAERRSRAIIGTSLPWRRTMDVVVQAAASEATVMLLGESGTGKELLARSLHDNSARAGRRASGGAAAEDARRNDGGPFVAATTRTSMRRGLPPPPRRSISPSCSTRSNLTWTWRLISPISSRNSVPPFAASKRPSRAVDAPVNAPFS